MDPAARRAAYAQAICAKAGCAGDKALIEAFARVPREAFLGPPPWRLAGGAQTAEPALLYQDLLVALGPRGLNNGQPSLHALALAAAAPRPGESVVQIGAGGGYYSAILAELVGPQGRVIAFECEPRLAARAAAALAPWPQIELHARAVPRPLPAVDLVYASAGASQPPAAWLDALKPGGRLVFPLTAAYGKGLLLGLRKMPESASLAAKVLEQVVFVDCQDERNETATRRLQEALERRPWPALIALHRGTPPAAERCWCSGEAWWLEQAS